MLLASSPPFQLYAALKEIAGPGGYESEPEGGMDNHSQPKHPTRSENIKGRPVTFSHETYGTKYESFKKQLAASWASENMCTTLWDGCSSSDPESSEETDLEEMDLEVPRQHHSNAFAIPSDQFMAALSMSSGQGDVADGSDNAFSAPSSMFSAHLGIVADARSYKAFAVPSSAGLGGLADAAVAVPDDTLVSLLP